MERRGLMSKLHDVLIIGAGQGGLSVSYFLVQEGINHLIVDRGEIANSWKANRWDSFCLVTPNWTVNLPGHPYAGDDPDGFMQRDAFAQYLVSWAESFGAPVASGIDVSHITADGGVFNLATNKGLMQARRVVVATATYQHPKIPGLAERLPASIKQFHAEAYKNTDQAEDGAVLVVGSGQTGCQIVEDFLRAGRKVYLCVARTGRLPRRYRGRDCLCWQKDMKLLERTPDMLEDPAQRFVGDPHLTGRDGGETVSLHSLRTRGVTLLGRLADVDGTTIALRDDLADNVRYADDFANNFMTSVDDHIARHNLSAPDPSQEELHGMPDEDASPMVTLPSLDLQDANINTVIWATGFSFDFSWIPGIATDAFGYPVTKAGASTLPGLYFCGLNWMTKRKSGILYGVAEDAREVAHQLAEDLAKAGRSPSRTDLIREN
jgi:putative flavoprotein involved in K+ transport